MIKKISLLSTIFIAMICFSCYKNPVERNKIVFQDSNQSVQDSLLKIKELLSILPKSTTQFNTNYYLQDDGLYINNSFVGNVESIKLDTIKAFANFNEKNKKEFIILSKYLNGNFITSGYFDTTVNSWLFEYRPIPDGDYHDTREIILLKGEDSLLIKSRSKILDHKKILFLLAPKDAIIR